MSEAEFIEQHLLNKQEPADKLLLEARLLLDRDLYDKIQWQKKTYALVNAYGRIQLKKEIEAVHQKLFSESRFEAFRKKVSRIFK